MKGIYLINRIIPKKSNYIYLRSHYEYKDNIHALLDCMLSFKLNEKFKIYCEGSEFKKYNEENVKYLSGNKFYMIWKFFRSKYVFFDGGIYGQSQPTKNQITINTWHGVSLKKIGYYIDGYNRNLNTRISTYNLVYSDFFIEVMSRAFKVPRECNLITGEPRNDYFFNTNIKGSYLEKLGINLHRDEKCMIWMPTYRKHKLDKSIDGMIYDYGVPFIKKNNIQNFNDFLKKHKIKLIIKWHGLEETGGMKLDDFCNIKFLSSIEVGKADLALNEIISDCDGLITDYSSVYINYLILNRPILFAYNDMDEYKNNRGFMFEGVEGIMPGPHILNLEELKKQLIKFAVGEDYYIDDRYNVNQKLNKYNDGNNSFRALQSIGLLNNKVNKNE